ncbi:hypothetical protein A5641_12210 [Mycobacterium sp. 1554424.7]|nr:hypothetical protein A5641_12210 [Mycobacterium sp. 1554424.7]
MNDPTARPGNSDLEPGSLEWSKLVCRAAQYFFNADPFCQERAEIAKLIDKSVQYGQFEPWNATEFTMFLRARGFGPTVATYHLDLLARMERAGMLILCGWDSGESVMGQRYISHGQMHYMQQGDLWLSEVLGPELIIESYNAATIRITRNGKAGGATGLALDRSHLVTNRHVVEGLAGRTGELISTDLSFKQIGADERTYQCRVHGHEELDVAVIEAEIAEGDPGFFCLPDIRWRPPKWIDEICVFGYPPVPGTVDEPITVQPGRVVNPKARAAANGGYRQHDILLFSAIARPGNSGGPIVAQDGRVIGLVEESAQDATSTAGGDFEDAQAPRFYRGIHAGEVVRAVSELNFSGLAWLDPLA